MCWGGEGRMCRWREERVCEWVGGCRGMCVGREGGVGVVIGF